ncbi:ABC transporter-related protein [hydrothermal vent metagenome]|uniref:ABC transporter-related protein n=1 Tax=hydrothermal vent metagenome TaxID=652676 RepID=A0A3B1E922_9ZZZZ
MNNSILKIDNLSFGYDKTKLIYNNLNLELHKGEIISIVGASGSGKTTLFELISTNLKQLSGTIATKKLSSIYQDPYSSFHPSFNIIDQIKDVADDFVLLDYICDQLSLDKNLLGKKSYELSGGQLQRCSILRAILMKPDIILADEPTSALDNVIALKTMQLLIKILDKVGILLITHDENLALWCSDKIIRIDKNE